MFGMYFYLLKLVVERKIAKYETVKYSFELSNTISNKLTHILCMLVSVSINQLLNNTVSTPILQKELKIILKGNYN